MNVTILKEHGHEEALVGMSYSYFDNAKDKDEWWGLQKDKAKKRAPLLAPMGGGHNKFLRQIVLWVDVTACRAWWSEFDQYKVGVTTQSCSTMHTLAKRAPMIEDFEEGTLPETIYTFTAVWEKAKGDVTTLKMNLPEGFLQRRMVTLNYDNLRNIINQREGHRLKWWSVFIDEIKSQVQFPEYLK